jgi:hypothetical protein
MNFESQNFEYMIGEASHIYCFVKLDRGAFCELPSARDLHVVQKCVSHC